jgi:uncharacterized membrane protein YphA (DoxX/SURF4 family)
MPEVTIRTAVALLALVFLWSGAAKVARRDAWLSALRAYHLPRPVEALAAPGVVIAEWIVVAMLVAGATRAGAASALALVSAFSIVVLRVRALQGDRLPCGCFGGRDRRDYRTMIARNGVLGALAALILVTGRDVSLLAGFRMPRSSEVLPAVLVAVAVLVLVWMILYAVLWVRRGQQ